MPGQLQAGRALGRDVLEVRRLAAHDRAQRDDAGVPARLGERHGGQGQLEGAGNRHDGDRVLGHTGSRERLEGTVQQAVGDAAVEARDDHGHRAPVAERRALDQRIAVGDVDLASHVLDADAFGRRVLDHRRRDGLRPVREWVGSSRGCSAGPAKQPGGRQAPRPPAGRIVVSLPACCGGTGGVTGVLPAGRLRSRSLALRFVLEVSQILMMQTVAELIPLGGQIRLVLRVRLRSRSAPAPRPSGRSRRCRSASSDCS